jgi:hypothetical protein
MTNEPSTRRRRDVSAHSLRSQMFQPERARDGEQASVKKTGATWSTVQSIRTGQLGRYRIHRLARVRSINAVGNLAGNLGELAHPEGSKRKQDVGQPGHVAKERGSVPQERFDAGPPVPCGNRGLIWKRGALLCG